MSHAKNWERQQHVANPRLCRVVGPKFREMAECEGGGWFTDPETAALIAAAPDGYALAVRVVEYFGGSTPDGLDAQKLDCDAELLRMALAIIAKVEGGV